MIEKQKNTNKCANPDCNREILEDKKYCNEDCLKRHLEIKKKPSSPILTDVVLTADNENLPSVSEAIFNLKDQRFQQGLAWRTKQVHAIINLINNGWSKEQILREMRHNGLTELTARKIIEDATC
jgi:hypothetical protein